MAQYDLAQRLEDDRLGLIDPGAYEAGDNTNFTIDRDGSNYLLRFANQPEVYVLYIDRASLGGRVLKYDSGKTVLKVTSFGAVTLYTDAVPSGLPAMRVGDAPPIVLPDVTVDTLRAIAAADAQRLALLHHVSLSYEANWDRLASDANLRAQCLDALDNTARALEQFADHPAGQRALAGQIQTVLVAGIGRPTLQRRNRQLIVTFDPAQGYEGRASSRAITRALFVLFHLPNK